MSPIDVPARCPFALSLSTALTASLLVLAVGRSRQLSLAHGALLLAAVVSYLTRVLAAPPP